MKKRNFLSILLCIFLFTFLASGTTYAKTTTRKPLIGVSGSMLASQRYLNYYFSYVSNYYIQAIVNAGGVPVIIPIVDNLTVVPSQIKNLDGLILSGGADINPLKYGEEPNRFIGTLHPERDEFDQALLRNALKRKIPVLGICRGHQFINVFHGGTLHQDIESAYDNPIEHRQSGNHEFGTHTVLVKKDSWLYSVLGKKPIVVNSLHHQAVKKLAPGFKVTAEAKDGVIEGIEKTKGSFCVGLQWHPEMMHGRNSEMLKLCKAFIKVCQDNIKKQTTPSKPKTAKAKADVKTKSNKA